MHNSPLLTIEELRVFKLYNMFSAIDNPVHKLGYTQDSSRCIKPSVPVVTTGNASRPA
uniref:Uncharacterized protein n=1 Tax=Arundo donax TaxID=35708 RepID=A0A0A9G8D7_ARUDO